MVPLKTLFRYGICSRTIFVGVGAGPECGAHQEESGRAYEPPKVKAHAAHRQGAPSWRF